MPRDDFPSLTVRRLAQRVGNRCSNPECRRDTSGPDSTADGSVNIGVAAHITAASVGGPRFDGTLTQAQRSAPSNGIWLCQACGKLIDSDEAQFTKELLQMWKASAERQAKQRLETPRRPQDINEPLLVLPSADPATSLLLFSARATTFAGRDSEWAQLKDFVCTDEKVAWLLLTGAAGTGKSRLALELCHDIRPQWNAGFLTRTDKFQRWTHFRPERPTLVVIDYVAGRADEAGALVLDLARSSSYLPHPVRILLLEREEGDWWRRVLREDSQTESEEMLACQYASPIRLKGLTQTALQAIAADVATRLQLAWNETMSNIFVTRMRTMDPLGRPLFGMMVAAYSTEITDALSQDLLSLVLTKEKARRRTLVQDGETFLKLENLAILATLVGGLLPRATGFEFLTRTSIASLLPNLDFLDHALYRDFVAATTSDSILAGFQPDVLGERLVLDRLGTSGTAVVTRRLLSEAWVLEPDDICDFIVRAASDFPTDPAIDILCDLRLESGEARTRWGWLVGDLIRAMSRSSDRRTQQLLSKLDALAQTHRTEASLQNALARAELHKANILLFRERNYEQAAQYFDAALRHSIPGTDIEASIRNNRGALFVKMQNEDDAFKDWSEVIANDTASDEARACSLNNRADIFARRQLHDEAIRDRSAVLALQQTSPDRRYIALIRRSRSYDALGQKDYALRDLTAIMDVADIAPEQKAEARFYRAKAYMEVGRNQEAEEDLLAISETDELFAGVLASSLVALAELARRKGNVAATREYLDVATSLEDVDDVTIVESLIVWARALADQGFAGDAEQLWQRVLANPHVSERQRLLAENSGRSAQPSTVAREINRG